MTLSLDDDQDSTITGLKTLTDPQFSDLNFQLRLQRRTMTTAQGASRSVSSQDYRLINGSTNDCGLLCRSQVVLNRSIRVRICSVVVKETCKRQKYQHRDYPTHGRACSHNRCQTKQSCNAPTMPPN
jgi:hypothetical protein